jgi:hypothetical protein
MGMTIALVVVSFIIMLIKPDNLSRTGTAVFIPLTILALQLTIADKIPVVGYYTLMDQFFLTCFITSMIVSIESGIVYTMITSKSDVIFRVFNRTMHYDKILKTIRETKLNRINTKFEHEDFIKMKKNALFPVIDELDSQDDFDVTNNILKGQCQCDTDSSCDLCVDSNRELQKTPDIETVSDITQRRKKIIEDINKHMVNDNEIVAKNVIKTIEFDNKSLELTYKEFLLFNEITRIFILVDNIFRIILPLTFFIIIGVIFSHDNMIHETMTDKH